MICAFCDDPIEQDEFMYREPEGWVHYDCHANNVAANTTEGEK